MSRLRAGFNINKKFKDGWSNINSLWKEGWVQIPEIMGAHVLSTLAVIGFGIMHIMYRNTTFTQRTFDEPLFLRPDDPRAKKTLTYYEDGWDEK